MNSFDIAKLAGVSRSTVSRVINNYSNVPEDTKKRVLGVIKEYNYVPHVSAQMLAGKKNKTLGLFIVDTKADEIEYKMTESSYFMPFTSAIVDISNKRQYNVLISLISRPQDFQNVKEIFYNKTICGGVFIGTQNYEPEIIDIVKGGFKTAVIGQEVSGDSDIFSKCIVVNTDSYGGAYRAVKLLIELGHTSIAHICGDMRQFTAIEKLRGYKQALIDEGLHVNPNLIMEGDYTERSGYTAAKKIISNESPTAIFTANDSMAIGVIRAAHELNMNIPDDISIIGFDDIDIAKYIQPGLTTLRTSVHQVVSAAINNLIKWNEQGSQVSEYYRIPVELILRGSCGRRFKK